ncbi:MAG TPA: energy transducer TonB [Acidisarcina sp.]
MAQEIPELSKPGARPALQISVPAGGGTTLKPSLGLLPEPEGRGRYFTIAFIANILFAGLLILFTVAAARKAARIKTFEHTELIFPVTVVKPPPPVVPKVKVVAPPPKVQPKIELPRQIQIPKPQPEPPKIEAVKLAPVMPQVPAARPKAVVTPPLPKVGLFASNNPTPVANNRSAPTVKTGGFGDPSGVVANPNANRPSNIATVGSFAAAPGAGQGAGSARAGSVHGTSFGSGVANGVPGGTSRGAVASAGFNSGTVGGTGTAAHGTVATANFSSNVASAPAAATVRPTEPATIGVVLTSKPRPAYTEEARQLRIEGQVTLQVRFTASGQVEVLRVVNGLGHGLDEEAKRAAMQIRFKPALKNGQPVDQISNVNITFQLA